MDRELPKVPVTLTVGSLFAGVGGFDIAAETAGMTVLWQSENDKAASNVLEHHWPGRNHGDIHNLRLEASDRPPQPRSATEGSSVRPPRQRGSDERHPATDPDHTGGTNARTPAVDVLTGGFPCQDYSVAGSRGGLAGDRGALWWQYLRLISEGRPTWVVAENVPGLLSSCGGQDFATIIDSLTECGYGVAWAILDAQYFGVAQRRRRVFIVGHSGGRPRPEILALGEGVFGNPEPSRTEGPAASALTASGVGAGGGPDDNSAQANHLIAFVQNQRDEVRDLKDRAGALAAEPGVKQQTYVAFGSKDSGQDAQHEIAPTLRAGSYDQSHLNGGVPPAIANESTVRRLTPLECQRLQGFPDDWYDGIAMSDTQRYRQLGNAVAVPVAEWIMKRIEREEHHGD